jgi:Ca2+-binding RTX toxin-like protein
MMANSSIFTEAEADDYLAFDISNDPPVNRSFGTGDDLVEVSGDALSQVRLVFTSNEVGNGFDSDSLTQANQNGSLAVRMVAENAAGGVTGSTSKFDDEGISFIANGNFTFDVRDLVSGIARGDQFSIVRLGTMAADLFDEGTSTRNTYINAGMGDDDVTGGAGDDFLVGGAGNDRLSGGDGNDSFIGGGGNDAISGGAGADTAIFNVSTDGADRVNLGTGYDRANISAAAGVAQVRLTFTSAEVGNNAVNDAGTLANQDGSLAVRLQAEGTDGALTGLDSRFDDEGTSFIASSPGLTFDVRDLVSGVARGDQFRAVYLGTAQADTYDFSDLSLNTYVNSGAGRDVITSGTGNDFLVGGSGGDRLIGGAGSDSFIGGLGNDAINAGTGDDTIIYNVSTDGRDRVNSGTGMDTANISAAEGTTQIRLTFTSAEVGNGSNSDSGTLANQDGDLAVRLQAEGGRDNPGGTIARFDDEGITFTSATPGVTFDVRDLVSGTARGDQFEVVVLGTAQNDALDFSAASRSYYVNAGAGNDTITGSTVADFLVGGVGADTLNGGQGMDSLLGGGGADLFVFTDTPGNDTIVDFASGTDKIDLSAFDISLDDIMASTSGTSTVLSVDTSGDGVGDFTITLNGVTVAPAGGDYVF